MMKWRALVSRIPNPLIVCVILALLVIPIVTFADSPPAGRARLVPVRGDEVDGPAAPGDKVALRQLVIASSADDIGLQTWRSILDKIGTPYDVLLADSDPFDAGRLVRPDGVGRYSAILLTDNALLLPDGSGNYISALDATKWKTLWDYERIFRVRQVALKTSPGTFPEDYCLRPGTEGGVDSAAVEAALTSVGAEVFDYLEPGARLPVQNAYLYRTAIAPDCNAQPLLTIGPDIVGVLSTAPDGRERGGLTFSLGPNQVLTELVGYGLLRWATRGVFLGEQRHWINVDVDDWFATTLRGRADGADGVFRMTGPETAAIAQQQADLRRRYPLSGDFMLNLAYNAAQLDPKAPAQCESANTPDPLSSYTRCLMDEFRWINHTFSHPAMNVTSYAENYSQIADNLAAASSIGLPVPANVLKTPEYSGLGVYSADPHSLGVPTDHGLESSNAEMLRAASDLGVKYVHGNMSFGSHRPACFNCGIYHPLQPDLFVVPDWPTNIAFGATSPDELTRLYNEAYGQNGSAKDHADHDLSYSEILDAEAEVALRHVLSGSAYAHTVHQGNLHVYEAGKSLTFDWLNVLLAKYSAYYRVPLKNPDWPALAGYVEARNSHFAALATNQDAVWNRANNAITYPATGDNSLFLTGLETRPATESDETTADEAEVYGTDTISRIDVNERDVVTLVARPRP
jgi:hypothetical protein